MIVNSMKIPRRHKIVLLALGIYWPVIFWLTHIPVPDVARQSGMSDKTMHVLAFFVLAFLVWFAVCPYQKARWNRLKVWVVLATVIAYAAIDEYLQGFIPGRSADVWDFVADTVGVVVGLGVLSIFSFWPAMLMFSAIFIFIISNLTNLPQLYPEYHLNAVFHGTAFAAFTLVWIQYLDRRSRPSESRKMWLTAALTMPLSLLLVIEVTAVVFDWPSGWTEAIAAVLGTVFAVFISYWMFVPGYQKIR
ncbi:MAG: VanZ family protein [Planctomycetota bacterium]